MGTVLLRPSLVEIARRTQAGPLVVASVIALRAAATTSSSSLPRLAASVVGAEPETDDDQLLLLSQYSASIRVGIAFVNSSLAVVVNFLIRLLPHILCGEHFR